jgi:superfamily II DNA or RNA helicase
MERTNKITRSERQSLAASRWGEAGGLGGIEAFTGFGKTKLTIDDIIRPVLTKIGTTGRTCYIVTHRVALLKQWKDNLKGLLDQDVLNRIEVVTGDWVLANRIQREITLLVIDEISEFYGNEEQKIWNGELFKYKFFVWLDATPKDKNGVWQKLYNIAPTVDKITRQEGLNNGWTTDCIQFNFGVDLSPEEQNLYDTMSKEIGDGLGKFGMDFNLASKCLSGDKSKKAWDYCIEYAESLGWDKTYPFIVAKAKPPDWAIEDYIKVIDINNLWHPEKIMGYAKKLMEMTRERNYLLHKATNKYAAAAKVAYKFGADKIVYFSQSTEFAHKLYLLLDSDELGKCVEYHSKIESKPLRLNNLGNPSLFGTGDYVRIKTKSSPNFKEPKVFGGDVIKKLSLEAFISNQARMLSLGSALDKGLDVPDIGIGVITSQTSNPNQYIQRKGRTTRLSNGKEMSILICIYAKNTSDQNNLRYVQKHTDGDVYWVDNVEDISFDYIPKEEEEIDIMSLL